MDTQPPDSQHSGSGLPFKDIAIPSNKRGIDAYAFWFAQQDTATQKQLIAQGLGPEAREGDGNYTFEVKPDHQAFSYEEEPMADPQEEGTPGRSYTEDEVQEVIRRVVTAMQLSESPDCLFQARCILIAFGIGDPPTETELAKQRDCSRQFVSKKVKRIQQLFNLSPSQYMRSEAACKAYADAWQRNHERRSQSKPRSRNRTTKPSTKQVLSPKEGKSPSIKLSSPSGPPQGGYGGKESIVSNDGGAGS